MRINSSWMHLFAPLCPFLYAMLIKILTKFSFSKCSSWQTSKGQYSLVAWEWVYESGIPEFSSDTACYVALHSSANHFVSYGTFTLWAKGIVSSSDRHTCTSSDQGNILKIEEMVRSEGQELPLKIEGLVKREGLAAPTMLLSETLGMYIGELAPPATCVNTATFLFFMY